MNDKPTQAPEKSASSQPVCLYHILPTHYTYFLPLPILKAKIVFCSSKCQTQAVCAQEVLNKCLLFNCGLKETIPENLDRPDLPGKSTGVGCHCLLQKKTYRGPKAEDNMLNITNYQRNANQNYNEIPPHTSQNGHHQTIQKQQMLVRVWKEGYPPTLLVGK